MKVNPQIFRAYDLRGVSGKDLSIELFEHLGKAYGSFIKRKKIDDFAIVGKDARPTSNEYSSALIRGLVWCGIDVIDIGLTFVGNFYWSQYYLKHRGGVYITASHNPTEYNGAKMSVDYSETMVTHQMNIIRKMVENEDYDKGGSGGSITMKNLKKEYIRDMKKRVKIKRRMKVLIDTSYATGGAIVPDVFKAFNIDVVEKHTKIDHKYPLGAPDPTETSLIKRLATETLKAKADIGFCYDSDGDRIGIVNEKGQIIWNDMLVALFAIDILNRYPGSKIMFNSLCSLAVPETIKKYGGKPFMWRTGHSFLKKKNQSVKAAFIGELSGHFFFSKDFYNHDDGIYSSLRLISYLSQSDKTLSELMGTLPKYVSSPEIKIGYPDDKKAEMVEDLAKNIKKDFPKAKVLDGENIGDGVRFETKTSMFVVRYSQNGPYITIKIEAKTKLEYERLRKYLAKQLKNYKDVNWDFGVSQNLLRV
jgi:phosphomannomutase/phosphoglucomutase